MKFGLDRSKMPNEEYDFEAQERKDVTTLDLLRRIEDNLDTEDFTKADVKKISGSLVHFEGLLQLGYIEEIPDLKGHYRFTPKGYERARGTKREDAERDPYGGEARI